jgi:hypothetical protein
MIWDESRRTVLHSVQRVLVLKRTAVFSVNGFMILNGQRIMALPCLQPSAALCDKHKLRSTPALSLHPGAQAPASPPPVIFRRITSPDVPPGITSWRSQPCVRRCSSAPCVPPKAALRLISAVRDFFQPSHVRSELSMFFLGSYRQPTTHNPPRLLRALRR